MGRVGSSKTRISRRKEAFTSLRKNVLMSWAVLAALCGGCSWPPGGGSPAKPPLQQPAETVENRREGELPTLPLPPTPDPALPRRGVL
jgi:hypothetical protein